MDHHDETCIDYFFGFVQAIANGVIGIFCLALVFFMEFWWLWLILAFMGVI